MEPLHHQNLEKVHTFVQQVNADTTCGKRFQITTEQLRLETGFPGPFTDVPYQQMSLTCHRVVDKIPVGNLCRVPGFQYMTPLAPFLCQESTMSSSCLCSQNSSKILPHWQY